MEFQSPSQRGGGAARTTSASRVRAELFQSPSQRGGGAAGQLYPLPQISVVFQSPSQRGGGTALFAFSHVRMLDDPRFNPLRKGEAAPPGEQRRIALKPQRLFQSPSQRGGGAAHSFELLQSNLTSVSIPFAKGRRCRPHKHHRRQRHSGRVSIPFAKGRRRRRKSKNNAPVWCSYRFNPLRKGEAAPPEMSPPKR